MKEEEEKKKQEKRKGKEEEEEYRVYNDYFVDLLHCCQLKGQHKISITYKFSWTFKIREWEEELENEEEEMKKIMIILLIFFTVAKSRDNIKYPLEKYTWVITIQKLYYYCYPYPSLLSLIIAIIFILISCWNMGKFLNRWLS